jgi:hypothetical protein
MTLVDANPDGLHALPGVDLPAAILQGFIDDIEADRVKIPIGHVFGFEQIVNAAGDGEPNHARQAAGDDRPLSSTSLHLTTSRRCCPALSAARDTLL